MAIRQTRARRLLSLLLAFAMVLSFLSVSAFAATVDETYVPGTYTGTATGYNNGAVTVTVTLENNGGSTTITDIQADGSTQSYWEQAVGLLDTIKEQNGTATIDVDALSGATLSKKAIVNATNDALSKAVQGFSGGTGTKDDPYQISSEAGLIYFREQVNSGTNYSGQYITLTDDITLTKEWTPIGTSTNYFAGTFDGAGHTIYGLKIGSDNSYANVQYAGLFGYVYMTADFYNVRLKDVEIYVSYAGTTYAGALVAYSKNKGSSDPERGSIYQNCYAQGIISVQQNDQIAMVGGLIGLSNQFAAVTNCGVDVNVTVNTGSKNGTVGGLIGMVSINPLIMNNYSLGDVTLETSNTGYHYVGGLFGQANGIVYNCYTTGSVTLTPLNNVTMTSNLAGGIAGGFAAACYVDSCYYSNEATVAGNGSGKSNSETVLYKTADEISSEDFVQLLHDNLSSSAIAEMTSNVTAAAITGCTDFAAMTSRVENKFYDWVLSDGTVAQADTLWTTGEIDANIFESGAGTETNPYIIKTAGQLRAFAASLNSKIDYTNKYVALGNDIDVSGSNWTPVGGSDWAFNGTFDGAGYTISGLTEGSKTAPLALDSENIYIGLFGVLEKNAVVKNVTLTDVAIYTTYQASAYIGTIAGVTQGSTTSNDYTGAVIDGCSVSGTIVHVAEKGNNFVGGLVGMQYKGAVINCAADIDVSCTVQTGSAIAEAGGLVGLNNRGLIANCYSLGDIYGSASRSNGDEGMASISSLVGVQAGTLVGCYGSGNNTTGEYSTYVGMVSGWVTGIGKSYNCWYDLDTTMTIATQNVNPVESIGTKVTSGVNDEGNAYTGGLVDQMNGYTDATYSAVAGSLNGYFSAYPADITVYGLDSNALKSWTYDEQNNLVTFGTTNGAVTYVQPECEKVVAAEQAMQDGVWYGRDESKASVVKITVADGEITNTEVVSGENSGEAYDAAVAEAKQKAVYGDFSHYEAEDASQFAGGSGTESDPYLISNEAQLRYLAYSINEDVDWSGVYFKQTANIDLSGSDWLPIGWALNAEVNGAKKLVAAYPFRGNYDGGDYTISGLTIGSDEKAADQMTSGLFGFTAGEYADNSEPTGEEQTVTLKNIHLEDVDIHASTRYETYTGGLLGNGQTGIYIDNCSVTGKIDVTTSESFARAGGLAANVLRGAVTNCWTDVDITASTDASNVYAGGMFSLTNRVTVINCYALGDVTGNSTNNNKVHIGGFTGQQGGVQINCYAAGNVISLKSTTDVGGMNGRNGGIAADYYCYYNTEATQKNGDATNETNVAVGVNANNQSLINAEGKTKTELASADFTALLNSNLESIDSLLSDTGTVGAFLSSLTDRGYTHLNYYQDNDLLAWALNSGTVGFGAAEANPGTSGSGGSSSGGGSGGASTYTVGTSSASNGSVAVSPTSAAKGTVVTVTVAPNAGYQLDTLAVTDASGNQLTLTNKGSGAYTFTMPASKVTVSAAFTKEAEDTPITTVSFTDVPSGEYYYDAVVWAVENGVTTGTTPATFSPNDSCTRAQMVTFLWRAAGSPAPTSGGNPFTDVSSSAYYYDAVLWAVENGITNGTSVTTFSPDDAVTRAQTVTFLWRTENTPAADVNNPFADVPAGTYYTDAVLWAVEHEVTNGTSVTTFSPDEDCVRAQIVTFLYRANSN